MNKNTLIGLGIGAAALAAAWHFWGRKWAMTMKGNAATVRQQAKSVAHSSIADREIQRNAPGAMAAGSTITPRAGSSIETGFQGAYNAGMALRAGVNS